MELYIVKVKDLFLSDEWESIGAYHLTSQPQEKGIKFYEDEATANFIADKMNGTVISLSEHNEVHR